MSYIRKSYIRKSYIRKSYTRKSYTRKQNKWSGWKKLAPNNKQRTIMLKKCGKKCFLGPNKSFPICSKNTCKINKKGVWSAYIRAKQWGKNKSSYKGKSKPSYKQHIYKTIANKSKRILKFL